MDDAGIQPFVHDTAVIVGQGGREKAFFRIFYKRHVRLPLNDALPGLGVQGDILVMRVGARNSQAIVNMRSGDAALADLIVRL